MSSIFGFISKTDYLNCNSHINTLMELSAVRGKNLSGVIVGSAEKYQGYVSQLEIGSLSSYLMKSKNNIIVGYTGISHDYGNGAASVLVGNIYCITDSLILNKKSLCLKYGLEDHNISDSELIATIVKSIQDGQDDLEVVARELCSQIEGELSATVIIPSDGKIILLSNCSSLYYQEENDIVIIATEKASLSNVSHSHIQPITVKVFNIPQSSCIQDVINLNNAPEDSRVHNLQVQKNIDLSLLEYKIHDIKRCSRCVLPETMPFIEFDANGVCNYCHSYKKKNAVKPKSELLNIVEPYRKKEGYDCVIPFSGGRDSCYALHIAVTELDLKPVTYTYDWGMVTAVGHRNISRMCSKLGVENILVAADIEKKRKNVSMNLKAWLKKPDLGMLNILTAGDKHFFQFVDQVKKANDIKLNLWGVNPLEVTHFKTGFLGIAPNFIEQGVYSRGVMKQVRYQSKRLKAMLKNPAYFNSSLWDTLIGEYYRSFTKQEDYYHVFDYWQWNEKDVDEMLQHYDWDRTVDSTCTWRIGDGVAGFYNYVYYTIAGFTEHDTFRSNQVREGQLTRDEALRLVEQENVPRYENLQWFFKVLGIDFNEAIKIVNSVPKLYEE